MAKKIFNISAEEYLEPTLRVDGKIETVTGKIKNGPIYCFVVAPLHKSTLFFTTSIDGSVKKQIEMPKKNVSNFLNTILSELILSPNHELIAKIKITKNFFEHTYQKDLEALQSTTRTMLSDNSSKTSVSNYQFETATEISSTVGSNNTLPAHKKETENICLLDYPDNIKQFSTHEQQTKAEAMIQAEAHKIILNARNDSITECSTSEHSNFIISIGNQQYNIFSRPQNPAQVGGSLFNQNKRIEKPLHIQQLNSLLERVTSLLASATQTPAVTILKERVTFLLQVNQQRLEILKSQPSFDKSNRSRYANMPSIKAADRKKEIKEAKAAAALLSSPKEPLEIAEKPAIKSAFVDDKIIAQEKARIEIENRKKSAQCIVLNNIKIVEEKQDIMPIYDEKMKRFYGKQDGNLIQINMNSNKPTFQVFTCDNSRLMTKDELFDFIGFIDENLNADSRYDESLEKMPTLYKKFFDTGFLTDYKHFSSVYADICTKLQSSLAVQEAPALPRTIQKAKLPTRLSRQHTL